MQLKIKKKERKFGGKFGGSNTQMTATGHLQIKKYELR
jgi:hypothetical protein